MHGANFSVALSPDAETVGMPAPTHRERKLTYKPSVLSCFLSRSDPLRLVLSGKFIDTAGRHPESEHGYQNFGAKIVFFSWLIKMLRPSNCLKIHPIAVFLLLTMIALVHPF